MKLMLFKGAEQKWQNALHIKGSTPIIIISAFFGTSKIERARAIHPSAKHQIPNNSTITHYDFIKA